MNIVVLTTATLHHTYFIAQLARATSIRRVFLETQSVVPSFETSHPFEDRRETYESDVWFDNHPPSISSFADQTVCESINDAQVVAELETLQADAVVVFGTGRLRRATIDACGRWPINLHGGDPEHYRGLDTHLWAIYHGDFGGLSTTLHRVNSKLDDGQIIANLPVPLHHGMELHQLRRANTEVCVRLTLDALQQLERSGTLFARPQSHRGRYYSFMPAPLKALCVDKFLKYTNRL